MANLTKSLKSIGTWTPSSNKLRLAIAAAFVTIAVITVIAAIKLRSKPSGSADEAADRPAADQGGQLAIKLSAEKLRAAQLHVTACQQRDLDDVRTVPGKITYNESRHLEINALVESVVTQVLVNPGQVVKKGEPLAVLSSPEIGLARDEVAQCRANLALAQKEAARTEEIATNLAALLELLKKHPEPVVIEKTFEERLLGDHRQTVVAAYSQLFLAEAVTADTRALEEVGGISGRLAEQRQSTREVAKAAFETACEQSTFAMSKARDQTRAAVQHAERLLAVSDQRLKALGGDDAAGEMSVGTALSELVSRAPFDGVVEERLAVTAAHVAAGQPLFVLADTDALWVSAEVPERDWNSFDNGAQKELSIRAPSLSDSETTAQVKFIQGKISPETRTLTIVGELDNRDKKFRPGMFVWVSVPMSQPRQALAVPATAIVDHEQSRFVFVADEADTFRRVDVKTGVETSEWVEITDGLQPGQQVVDRGTFVLKSELLLEYATK